MKKLGKKVISVLMTILLMAGALGVSDGAVSADEIEPTESTAIAESGRKSSGAEEPETSVSESTEAETSTVSETKTTDTGTSETFGTEQPNGSKPITSNSETEENEGEASTDAYSASIVLAGNEEAFYGGEIITVYNNISVSGNLTVVPDGKLSAEIMIISIFFLSIRTADLH
jgi:cytoskeletal protein RodZ